jgi:hypothetical protein
VKYTTTRESSDPKLVRKFNNWSAKNFDTNCNLVKSVMSSFSRLRLKTYVMVIGLKELGVGFHVRSAEVVLIDSLPNEVQKTIRDMIQSSDANSHDMVCCVVMFDMISIDGESSYFSDEYGMGYYSELRDINEDAGRQSGRREQLIKCLNENN